MNLQALADYFSKKILSRYSPLQGVASDDSNFYFNLLCDIDFLGIETANGFHLFP